MKKKDAPAALTNLIKKEPLYDVDHRATLQEENTILNLACRMGRLSSVKATTLALSDTFDLM